MKPVQLFSISMQRITRKLLSLTIIFFITFLLLVTPPPVQAAEQTSKVSNSIGNMLKWNASCKDGNYIYYSIYGTIYRINVKTLKKEMVLSSKKAFTFMSMNISDGWIYCTMNTYMGTGGESCYIYKVRTNGKDGKQLAQGHSPTTINGWIYYIAQKNVVDPDNTSTLGIYKMKQNGQSKTCIRKTSTVSECVSDGLKLYYSTWDTNRQWYQMDLKGTNIQKIGKTDMNLMDIEKGYFYYSTYNYDTKTAGLYKQKIGTTKSTKILSSQSEIHSVNVDNGWIYLHLSNQKQTQNTMYKMKTNGTNKTKLISKDGLGTILIHGNFIYYTAYTNTYSENNPYNTFAYLMTINGMKNTLLKKYYES